MVTAPARRYESLDSLRGICACMVVLYHLHPDGLITSLAIVRNGWLFVDFFFVLSGFVIAASYGERLASGYPVSRFMGLRMGRVYPLHLFTIALMVAINLVATGAALAGESTGPSLVANLLLLHSFGVTDGLTWNGPSWSIAAEIWAYLSFALLVGWSKRIDWRVFLVVAMLALLTLIFASENYLATTWRLGFLRCLFGFSLGVLVWLAHRKWPQRGSTAVEMAVIALAIVHVSLIESGYLTFLAPPVFAILVFVFANESGALSTALKARPLRFLGLLSYAIYMLHELALARYFEVLGAIEKWLGMPMSNGQHIDSGPIRTELLTLGALAFTVFLAWFAWRFVEMPMREWSRRKLAGDQPKPD